MAQIISNSFQSDTTVKIYLLNDDGSLNTSVPPIEALVRPNGILVIKVPYDNGEKFKLTGINKQNTAFEELVTVADTTAPNKPNFVANDDVGAVQGPIKNNSTTDDNTPTLSGTSVEKGGVVIVYDNGVQIGTATVKPDGSWSFTPPTALLDGPHTITVRQIDATGNGLIGTGNVSDPLTFTVDTQPVKVTITKAIDDVGLYQGDLGDKAITDDAKPTLVGTGLANSVVHILENGTEIGSATVDATGNWTFELPTQTDGTHSYTATITNAAGVTGTTEFTLTIDTHAPTSTAELTSITEDSGVVGDFIANDPTLVLSGKTTGALEPTDKVQVSVDGGKTWTDATVDPATGTWSLDNTGKPLADGTHDVVTRVVDQAGNIGPLSTPQTITIDTQAPTATATFSGISEDTGVVGDYITSDKTLIVNGVVNGALGADEVVQIRVDGGAWVNATVDRANNTWSFDNTANTLTDGVHKFETRVVDVAGNANTPVSQDVTISSEVVDPHLAFTGITEDTGIVGDYITSDNTLIVNGKYTGTLGQGDVIQVSVDGGKTWHVATVDPVAKTWSFDNTANPLPDGDYTFEARVIDVSGNTTAPITQVVTVDTTINPPDPGILTFDSITEDTGTPGDFITSDNTLLLNGTFHGASDEHVQVSLDGGKTWLDATLDRAQGTWTYDNTAHPLADGTYTFEARLVDIAGNTSAAITHEVVIDTTFDPTTEGSVKFTGISDDTGADPHDFKTNDTTLIVHGEIVTPLSKGASVEVSLDGGKTWHVVQVDQANNTWTFDNTANVLPEGTYTFEARIVDLAGNKSTPVTQTVVIDTTPSAASAEITSISTDTNNPNDFVTSDNTLILNGKIVNNLGAGDVVQVSFDNGATWLDAQVDATNHTWTLDHTNTPLADGTYNVQTRVLDDVGNVTTPLSKTIVVDTTAPTETSKLVGISEDTGTAGDFVTSDNTLEFKGQVSAPLADGETVQISLNGGKTWITVPVDPQTNTWVYDNTANPLADGTYQVQSRVVDLAGNIGDVTSQNVVIDTRPPVANAILTSITDDTGVAGDYITNDTTLVFAGKVTGSGLVASDSVQISLDNGVTWLDAKLDFATRTWSYDHTATPLTDGTYSVLSRVVDLAGNAGAESEQSITIDTVAPTAHSSLVSITTDSGIVGDYITNDNTLIFKGKVDGPLATDERVQISLDDGATWEDVVFNKVNGTWTFNNTANEMDDGSYTVKTRVVDKAGNAGQESTDTVVIDTSAPTATATLTAISDDTGVAGDFITSDNTLKFEGNIAGTLATDERVQISLDNGKTWQDVTLDRVANTWSFDNTANTLNDGTYHVQTRVIDTANNAGAVTTQDVVVSTHVSVATVEFTGITTDSGVVGDYITNDNTLVINGKILNTLATGDYVEVSVDGGKTWNPATVDSVNHTWSYDNTANVLPDGTYDFEARVVSASGVAGTPAKVTVEIDTTAPTDVTAKLTAITEDTGVVGDFNTSDNTLIFNGEITGPLGATDSVKVSLNGGKTWVDAVVDHANQTWTYDNTANPMVDGTYDIQVKVVDQAGNEGNPTHSSIVIDTRPPVVLSEITGITEDTGPDAHDFKTNDNTLIITGQVKGTLTTGDFVEVSLDNGATWHSATVDASGKWSYDNTANVLPDGTYTFLTRVSDLAGNTGIITDKVVEIQTTITSSSTSVFTGITEDTGPDAHDYKTNDQTLIINGKVENGPLAAGERVQLSLDDGKTWVDAKVDPVTGTWSYDNTANSLAEGTYTFITRVTDVFNNHSAETQQVVTIDLTPPPAQIEFTGISDDTGIPGDYKTSDTTLIVNGKVIGTLATNERVEVSFDGGKTWAEATVDRATNTWSLDNTANPLSSGVHHMQARVIDDVNNVGQVISQDVTIVTEPPTATAELTGITDDSGVVGDFVTNDNTLIFNGKVTGTLDPDEKIQISFDNGQSWHDATLDPTGKTWSFDNTGNVLPDGTYEVVSRVVDSTGTPGTSSTTEIVIDTAAPTATTLLTAITDDSGTPNDFITNDNTLVFSGTVTGKVAADEHIEVSLDGGKSWTTAQYDSVNNTWTLDNTAHQLVDGTYQVQSRVVDKAGNIGSTSAIQDVVVDTVAPASIAKITGITDDTGINGDFITKDNTLIISGNVSAPLAADEHVQVSLDGGKTWLDAKSTPNGSWTCDNTANVLPDGTYTVEARVIDAAGNFSAPTTQVVVVDTVAPTAAELKDIYDDVGDVVGSIPKGGDTDDSRPDFSGTAPKDAATVNIYDNGNLVGSAAVQPDGTWKFTPTTPLTAGPHSFTVAPVDVAGNEGPQTAPWAFTLLGDAPPAPAITDVVDNVEGGLFNQTIPKDGFTNDKTPTVSGTGQVGAVIHVYSDNVEVGSATVKADGTWSVELNDLGADGEKHLKAQAVDGAGQKSPFTGDYVINLDTVAPDKPAFVATDDVGDHQGPIHTNDSTDDNTPTLTGTGEVDAVITIYDGKTPIGSTTVKPDGTWSFTPTTPLADGSHDLTITATDKAGNTSTPSDALKFDVDTRSVQITLNASDNKEPVTGPIGKGAYTNDDTPVLSGTTESGALVTITENGQKIASVQAKADGTWSIELPHQADGSHNYTATASLANGNSASASTDFIIDTVKPLPVVIDQVIDDVGIDQGDLKSGAFTDDTTPTIVGHAEPNAVVIIYENNNAVGSVIADSAGKWSYTIPNPGLTDGLHSITATQTDLAGNVSDPTSPFDLNIDTKAPDNTAIISSITDDSGVVGDFITNDNTLIITATPVKPLSVGDRIQISLDGGDTWKETVKNADGTWSYDNTANALADGKYKFETRVLDAAGNPGNATSQTVVIDTKLDVNTTISMSNYEDNGDSKTDFYSNDTQFTLNVKGEAGAKVVYQTLIDGKWTDLNTSTIGADNTSSYNVDWSMLQLNDVSRKFRATVTDTAGNSQTAYLGGADEASAQVYRIDNVPAKGTFNGKLTPSEQGGLDIIENNNVTFSEKGVRTFHVYEQNYRGTHTDAKVEITGPNGLQTDANGKLDLSSLMSHIDIFKNYYFETVDAAGNPSTTTLTSMRLISVTETASDLKGYDQWYYNPVAHFRDISASAVLETSGINFYNDAQNLAGFSARYVGSGYINRGEVKVYLTVGGETLETTVDKNGYWEFSYNGNNPIPAGSIAAIRLVPETQVGFAETMPGYRDDLSVKDIMDMGGFNYGTTFGVGSYSNLNAPIQYIKGQADTGDHDWKASVVSQEYTSTRDNDAFYSNGVATTVVYKVLDTITADMNSHGSYLGETGTTLGHDGYGMQFDIGTFGNTNLNGWIDRNGDDLLDINGKLNADFVDVNGDNIYDGSTGVGSDAGMQVTDIWNHFDATKDKLNISEWIAEIQKETGITISDSNIKDFLHADYITNAQTGAVSTVLSIDRDGKGTTYESAKFLTLEASGHLNFDELLKNNIIIH